MHPVRKSVRLLNGKQMPMVGLGTWQSGSGDAGRSVKVAIEAGYRHIDTAQMYGNEGEIGDALEEIFEKGDVKREDIFITTKLANCAMAPEDVRPQAMISLKKLKTEYIDLFLIHGPFAVSNEGLYKDPPTLLPMYANNAVKTVFIDPLDTWREMEKLVDDGLVKAIGLSNFNKEQISRIYEKARVKPSNLQVECHAWFPQYELVDFCQQRGISVSAYAPIGSPSRPAGAGPKCPPLLEDPTILKLAEKHQKTAAQILIRNLLQRGILPLPKSFTPERIKSNIQVFDFELDGDDMEVIKGVNKELRLFDFRILGKQNFKHPFYPWPASAEEVAS